MNEFFGLEKLAGEISPLMPNSCRYVPTCSEYSMIAYKKYGVVKGSVLTAWRLCRCNPLGIILLLYFVVLVVYDALMFVFLNPLPFKDCRNVEC